MNTLLIGHNVNTLCTANTTEGAKKDDKKLVINTEDLCVRKTLDPAQYFRYFIAT